MKHVFHLERDRDTKDVFVRPAKAGAFGGRQTHQGKSQNLVAWMTERRETNALKLIDKATFGVVSELPGLNESERIGDLESFKPRRPSPQRRGEGSMGR